MDAKELIWQVANELDELLDLAEWAASECQSPTAKPEVQSIIRRHSDELAERLNTKRAVLDMLFHLASAKHYLN